jgi:histidinol-phosphate aminotransferase
VCLTYLDPCDEAVYPWISFEAYPISVTTMGGTPVTVALVEHAFDLEAVAEAVTVRTKLVLLATPNNPTGTAVSTAAMGRLLERLSDDVVVVIDEAYREFADPALGDPVRDLLPHHRNALVLRTFSKAYGLAGLRCGYAIGDPELIADLDRLLLPFAVNQLAQTAALAAIAHRREIQPSIDALVRERTRVATALAEAGWRLPDSQANFVYLPLGVRTEAVHLDLERQGVATRPFPGQGLRVTVGSPAENDRFLATLAAVARP